MTAGTFSHRHHLSSTLNISFNARVRRLSEIQLEEHRRLMAALLGIAEEELVVGVFAVRIATEEDIMPPGLELASQYASRSRYL